MPARLFLQAGLLALAAGGVVSIVRFPVLLVLVPAALWWRRSRPTLSDTSHGTARWADLLDLTAHGMLSLRGVVLGRASYVRPPPRRFAWSYAFSRRLDAASAVRLFRAAFGAGRDHSLSPARAAFGTRRSADVVHGASSSPP